MRRWVFGLGLSALGLTLAFLAAVPTGRYLARAGWEEARILWRRQPISALAADTAVDPATRAKLAVVQAARAFAAESLGLDAGRSFTQYTALDRDTLVLVLSAAYRDELRFYRWWFPVVGRVPYKGYFDFAAAQRAEEGFRERGFDTELRPASAFSTLGWFNDPLLSTTIKTDSLYLANTVIHELTHNTFYAAGQAEFNESFANFVGARGSAAFYRARGNSRVAAHADARWRDEKVLAAFWRGLYNAIDTAFKQNPGDTLRDRRLALRDSIYGAARGRLVALAPSLQTTSPAYLERVRLDNAALLARRIYQTDLDLFDAVYEREGKDVRRALERIIAIAKSSGDKPYDGLRQWLLASEAKRP